MPVEITQNEAIEAGKICGALLFNFLWQLQHDSTGPVTIPLDRKPVGGGKKYLTSRQAADLLGVGKTRFFELKKKDPSFPLAKDTPSGRKFLRAEVERYSKALKPKQA